MWLTLSMARVGGRVLEKFHLDVQTRMMDQSFSLENIGSNYRVDGGTLRISVRKKKKEAIAAIGLTIGRNQPSITGKTFSVLKNGKDQRAGGQMGSTKIFK